KFKDAAEAFLKLHEGRWTNAKHQRQWRSTLQEYAFPLFGHRPTAAIDEAIINEALQPIWTKTPVTAGRIKQRILRVTEWVKGGMPLPGPARSDKDKQPALPYSEIGTFIAELRSRDTIPARALEITILTALRAGEVVGAKWGEIDLAGKVWTVPA